MFRALSSLAVRCAVGLVALVLTACGGSQQSLPPSALPSGGGNYSGAAFSRVTVIIKLPRKTVAGASVRRRPLFISPSIASVIVTVSAAGSPTAPVTSNVVCTTAVPPSCTVTAAILAPVEKQDTFTIVAYDGPNGTGNVLSQGSIVYPVAAGQALQIPIVLQGTVVSIVAVNVTNANPVTGSSATSNVTVTAADADGNVIAGQYQAPLSLQLFENDSEGLFSFVSGGLPQTTSTVTGSANAASVYLKAKPDLTTPDDATIIATLPNAPFVPGTSPVPPPLSSLAEITTTCPASSPTCVFYPNAYQILATFSILNHWDFPNVFPATPQDASGANEIWSVPLNDDAINGFNTVTNTFSTVSTTAPSSNFTNDIAGTFWADSVDVNTQLPAVTNFSSQGTTLANYDLTGNGVGASSGAARLASSLDSNGTLWGIDSGSAGLFALNLATGAATYCTFESTDVNFQSASVTALALAGQDVWVGISGAQDGNTYLFKIPVQLASSTCDLTTLKTAANEFQLTSQYSTQNSSPFAVTQIAVDSSGDVYALQLTSVTKITPSGQAVKLVDTGLLLAQIFLTGFTLDPSGTFLYISDLQAGTIDRASTITPSTNPLPSIPFPAAFGVAGALNTGVSFGAGYYQPFFTADGSLWVGAVPFVNPSLPFSLLGTSNGGNYEGGLAVYGGLVRFTLGSVTFAARAVAPPRDPAQIIRMLRSRRAPQRGSRQRWK